MSITPTPGTSGPTPIITGVPSPESLDRYIDRFLAAAGWRVTGVVKRDDTAGYEVTLTKELEPDKGRTVTRSAASAGEATFKACSSARLPIS